MPDSEAAGRLSPGLKAEPSSALPATKACTDSAGIESELPNQPLPDILQGIVYTDAEVEAALAVLSSRARLAKLLANLCGLLALGLGALLMQQILEPQQSLSFLIIYIGFLLLRLTIETLGANFARPRTAELENLQRSGLAERILCGEMSCDDIFSRSLPLLRGFALGPQGAGLSQDLIRIGTELQWYRTLPSSHLPRRLWLAFIVVFFLAGSLALFIFDNLLFSMLSIFFALLYFAGFQRSLLNSQQILRRLLDERLPVLRKMQREDPAGLELLLHYYSNSRLPLILHEILDNLSIKVDIGAYVFLLPFAPAVLWFIPLPDYSFVLVAIPYLLTVWLVLVLLHFAMWPRLKREVAVVGAQLEKSSILLEALSEQIGGDELREALPASLRWLKSRRKRAVSPRRSAVSELQETLRQVAPQLGWYTGERGANLKPLYDLLTVLLLLSMLFAPPGLAIARLIPLPVMAYMLCASLACWGYIAWWQVRRQRAFTKLLVDHIFRLAGD